MYEKNLIEVSKEAVYKYLLPAINKKLPEIKDKICILLTSSPAYGVADRYSDLDLFIIFEKHQNYVKYKNKLEQLIKHINFPSWYRTICDKGVRFELESLYRSDISKVYYHPTNKVYWMLQSDWLLYWFLNSVTIYDPSGIKHKLYSIASFYPADVLNYKLNTAFLKIRKYLSNIEISLSKEGTLKKYIAFQYLFKLFNQLINILFWSHRSYSPHPKWKYYIAKKEFTEYESIFNEIERVIENYPTLKEKSILGKLQRIHWQLEQEFLSLQHRKNSICSNRFGYICLSKDVLVVTGLFIDYTKFMNIRRLVEESKLNIYFSDEIGWYYLEGKRYNYDIAMRISDMARWLILNSNAKLNVPIFKIYENNRILKKRFCYLNFVLWRKIRVVEKAIRRNQIFNVYWYSLQVLEHFMELLSRIHSKFLPPLEYLDIDYVQSIDNIDLTNWININKLYDLLNNNPEEFIEWCWDSLTYLQKYLRGKKMLSDKCIKEPLKIQFDIEYWKYENLFL